MPIGGKEALVAELTTVRKQWSRDVLRAADAELLLEQLVGGNVEILRRARVYCGNLKRS